MQAVIGDGVRVESLRTSPFPRDEESVDEPVEDLDEVNEVIPFTYSITSYGADYPVDSLVDRLRKEDVLIPKFSWNQSEATGIEGFQREYVWTRSTADRFIESLLLGLPVPGIFLFKQDKSSPSLVLDGYQRLFTLLSYYDGMINGKEYCLDKVQEPYKGKRYGNLDVGDRRRLDDSIIHAIIIRQDEPTNDQSSIYSIFERLNRGGVNLQPQEIRVALYHGEFVRVLQKLNEKEAWRKLYGKKSTRLKDMEMILRFFALLYDSSQYRSPMKDFLNRYMASNQSLQRQSEEELVRIFDKTTQAILMGIGDKAFRPKSTLNAAVVDSLMVGVAKRLTKGGIKDNRNFREKFDALMKNADYLSAIRTWTSEEIKVRDRLTEAEAAFSQVP
uniref:GmrSD restriction endonucleases N-terminal domain-containing protein n=1 Tax=Candidatus Kentrum eta TaxID=2126337 RepID=A0A450V196_9GAMM|nr:MAG: Protein of unknown function DUF262 [Candidatus Kentron sp. H]VFJ91893.1 MAG: Protein of unknown function DUF262 [Candidatus Kentron sp. H]VFJ98551.1 MAG: Protein of unknown function DUF262 [Candidatus Kentron sp. H]